MNNQVDDSSCMPSVMPCPEAHGTGRPLVLLPGAFPGTMHVTLVHHAEWLRSMATAFLGALMPEAG